MAQTIAEQERQREVDLARAELERQRIAAATLVEKLAAKIEQLDEARFHEKLGTLPVSEWTTPEKSRYVTKHGAKAFADLVLGRR